MADSIVIARLTTLLYRIRIPLERKDGPEVDRCLKDLEDFHHSYRSEIQHLEPDFTEPPAP